jgi:hypothetical protein
MRCVGDRSACRDLDRVFRLEAVGEFTRAVPDQLNVNLTCELATQMLLAVPESIGLYQRRGPRYETSKVLGKISLKTDLKSCDEQSF